MIAIQPYMLAVFGGLLPDLQAHIEKPAEGCFRFYLLFQPFLRISRDVSAAESPFLYTFCFNNGTRHRALCIWISFVI